ncbi:hypothetical protein E8E13_004357 [Curvularia kusanoi]|uniref:Alpha/beta hydrolase fold-3 domain-containing protein n=1 Tax=Curvularia kusanoi TaxID=90978 RepID=A0A9P4T6G9_CURKU|nr:hypothetical protein E8E13_004357 [Curvularia kusanoi]
MFSRSCLSRAYTPIKPSLRSIRPTLCSSIIDACATRAYSIVTSLPRVEHFDVQCRSSGSIKLDVYHALDKSSPVIIYLPPGPVVPQNLEVEEGIIAALHASSAATIVRINYRASPQHQFPTPYQDVLYGYDWIQDNLLVDGAQRPYAARLGVHGELMGGSIATMLGLTECRVGESRIVAAAVNNPIVDWVFPDSLGPINPSELPEPTSGDETAFPAEDDMLAPSSALKNAVSLPKSTKQRKRRKNAVPLTSWQAWSHNHLLPTHPLTSLRHTLFRRQDDIFDRFASPIHFFRSPHAQLIHPQSSSPTINDPDYGLDVETQLTLSHYTSFHSQEHPQHEPLGPPSLTRVRSYARVYPQAGSGKLALPCWRITTGSQSPLNDQAAELAKVLRRSIARHSMKSATGRTRAHDSAEKQFYEDYAEERVAFASLEGGVGLWTMQQQAFGIGNGNGNGDKGSSTGVGEVGAWMKQQLEDA